MIFNGERIEPMSNADTDPDYEPDPETPIFIQSVRGQGYRLGAGV